MRYRKEGTIFLHQYHVERILLQQSQAYWFSWQIHISSLYQEGGWSEDLSPADKKYEPNNKKLYFSLSSCINILWMTSALIPSFARISAACIYYYTRVNSIRKSRTCIFIHKNVMTNLKSIANHFWESSDGHILSFSFYLGERNNKFIHCKHRKKKHVI